MSDIEQTDSESSDVMETSVNIQENSDSEATDSESTDEEADEDAKDIQSFFDCLSKIEQNKYNYDSYVELLVLAHETGDLEKIRQSYELFASVFPLAPEHWLKWLRLELNISTTPPEIKRVFLLFQRALSDYFSSEVALELANLALKSPKSDDIWEQLLSTYTLHCTQGRSIFEAYRLYLAKQENSDSEEYYQKLIEAYERELAIPLNDMEETYIELKCGNQTRGDEKSTKSSRTGESRSSKARSEARRRQLALDRIEEERILKEARDKEYLDKKYLTLEGFSIAG